MHNLDFLAAFMWVVAGICGSLITLIEYRRRFPKTAKQYPFGKISAVWHVVFILMGPLWLLGAAQGIGYPVNERDE